MLKYIYPLLALVPIAFILEFLVHPDATIIFAVSALALIPLAAVLGKATEELAIHTGPRIGGLLNATLGNAAELIIAIVALNAGLVTLVKASIIGSILGNILVVLGLSLLLGGLKNGPQFFNRTEAGVVAALLLLSVIAMGVPTAFSRTVGSDITTLSDEVAFVMILMYVAYLAFIFSVPKVRRLRTQRRAVRHVRRFRRRSANRTPALVEARHHRILTMTRGVRTQRMARRTSRLGACLGHSLCC